MPTFFSRRYMRGKPRRTERVVGVFVLVLLGLIVGSFLLTSGLLAGVVTRVPVLAKTKAFIGISEKPLFLAEESTSSAPAHEIREGLALLPAAIGDLKREGLHAMRVEPAGSGETLSNVASFSDILHDAPLMALADDFGATWIYQALYVGGKAPLAKVLVSVVDAGTPEAAFGMSRPSGLSGSVPGTAAHPKPLSVGRGGWAAENICRFWSGRHCTQLALMSERSPEAQALLESLARQLSSVQLAYGGPFWAESVLPSEGRVEGSFRYLKKNALGLAELADCWLADYPGGITMGVMQAPSIEKTLAAVRERLQRPSTQSAAASAPASESHGESGDEYGEEEAAKTPAQPDSAAVAQDLGDGAVAGTIGDRAITVFRAASYAFVVTGPNPGALTALAKATHERWSAAGVQAGAVAQAVSKPGAAAGLARFADVSGGDIATPTKIERYTDNLYEKIDGREGQFRAYNFVELRFAQYLDTRRQQAFDVYIYDMAEPLNAMGIFMTERTEEAEPSGIGRDGYLSGANAYFWKGKYYVNVLGPTDAGEAAADAARRIATAIAETISSESAVIWAEKLLPKEDQVPASFNYRATSALGYDFLQQLFLADYRTGDKTYKMFILKAESHAAAREIFGKFADATAKYDKIVSREPSDGGETLVGDSLGVFSVAFYRGAYFAGVTECEDRALAVRRGASMRDSLPAETSAPAQGAAPATKPTGSGPGPKVSEGGEYGE